MAIIRAGAIVVEGPPDALGAGSPENEILFVSPDGIDLDELPVEQTVQIVDGRARLHTLTPTRLLARLCGWAAERGIELERLEVRRPSLEDVYLELVTDGEPATEPAPWTTQTASERSRRPT